MEQFIKIEDQISEIKTDIGNLKTTLIGLDGKNGMRSQIVSLKKDLEDLQSSLNELLSRLDSIRSEQEKTNLIYATKDRLKELENKICRKLENIEENREKEKKETESQKKIEKLNMDRLKNARYSLYVAIAGLVLKEVLTLIPGMFK